MRRTNTEEEAQPPARAETSVRPEGRRNAEGESQPGPLEEVEELRRPDVTSPRMALPLPWIHNFKRSGERSGLRGESLHRYRCSSEELEELGLLLSATKLETSAECACFALYAAEWLRRNFDGGAWTWQGVFSSLKSPLSHPPYDSMESAMRDNWGLDIVRHHRSRQLLSTLLMQGGLPLRVIERDGHALRRLFVKLLGEAIATPIPTDGLAAQAELWSEVLPQTWRHPSVYRLLAEVTEAAARLSTQIPEGADPIESLDEKVPGWETRLPLSMTEEVGRALFSFMVKEAHGSAAMRRAPIRVVNELYEEGDSWRLVRRIQLPQQVSRRELVTMLGLSEETELPYRLELHAQNEHAEQQHLATATLWKQGTDGPLYLVEPRTRSGYVRVEGSLELMALSGTAAYDPAPLDGGEERGPLPWVFRPLRSDDSRWEMVSQGSARLRAEEAVVLVGSGAVPLTQDGEVEELGRLDDRRILLLMGRVRILSDGELCRITLGESEDDAADYALSGSQTHGLGNREAVFRGPPVLLASRSGHRYAALHRGRQEWRREGETWSSRDDTCRGRIELRHVVGDETMHVRRNLHVVPATFEYTATPDRTGRSGRLEVKGLLGAVTAELVDDETFTAEKSVAASGRVEWQITAVADGVPRFAELRLHWSNTASSILKVPLPVADARFIMVDGSVLPDEAHVSLGELHRVVAEVIGAPALVRDARLVMRLHDRQIPSRERQQLEANMPLRPTNQAGVSRLELRRISEAIRLRFAASQRPDARVELMLELQGQTRELRVQRHRYGISYKRDEPSIVGYGSPPELSVESFPVDDPSAPAIEHELVDVDRWAVEVAQLEDSSRLAVGRIDGQVVTSAVLLTRPPEPTKEGSSGTSCVREYFEPGMYRTLADCSRIRVLAHRKQAFSEVLVRLERDLDDPDWTLLHAYVDTLDSIHASTFDVMESLILRPRAVVLSLLRAPVKRWDSMWSALEDLPFAWHTLPVRDWAMGTLRWLEWMEHRLGERTLPLHQIEQLRPFVTPRIPGSDFVFSLVEAAAQGQVDQVVGQLALFELPGARAPRQEQLSAAKSQLIKDTAARAEATGERRYTWPSGPLVSRLAEVAPKLVPDLADLLYNNEPGFRVPLLNAPVIAALWAVAPDDFTPDRWNEHSDIQISARELLFELRRMQLHAPRWYASCYSQMIVDAIARRRQQVFGELL